MSVILITVNVVLHRSLLSVRLSIRPSSLLFQPPSLCRSHSLSYLME